MVKKFYNIHGLLKIGAEGYLDLDKSLSYFVSSTLNNLDLMIKIKQFDMDLSVYNRLGRYYLGKNEVIEKRKFGSIRFKNLFGKTELDATSGYVKLRPFGTLIGNILNFKLLAKNHALVHSACISEDGEGCLICAWQGTGKTMVALKLVKEKASNFLSDDMTIIDNYGQAYCFPANVKLSLSHASEFELSNKVKLKLLIGKLIEQIPIVRRRLEITHLVPITKLVENARIERRCKIRKLVLLQQAADDSVNEIDMNIAVKRLALLNLWERIYWIDHLFIAYAYSDKGFDLQKLEKKEQDIIQSALKDASCYEVKFRKYAYDNIRKLLRA